MVKTEGITLLPCIYTLFRRCVYCELVEHLTLVKYFKGYYIKHTLYVRFIIFLNYRLFKDNRCKFLILLIFLVNCITNDPIKVVTKIMVLWQSAYKTLNLAFRQVNNTTSGLIFQSGVQKRFTSPFRIQIELPLPLYSQSSDARG